MNALVLSACVIWDWGCFYILKETSAQPQLLHLKYRALSLSLSFVGRLSWPNWTMSIESWRTSSGRRRARCWSSGGPARSWRRRGRPRTARWSRCRRRWESGRSVGATSSLSQWERAYPHWNNEAQPANEYSKRMHYYEVIRREAQHLNVYNV